MKRNGTNITPVVTLLLAGVFTVILSLLLGEERVSLGRAWVEWQSGAALYETRDLNLLLNHRLPRTLAALLAGAGLALAGCAFQALLRNPLATPYTLGVSSASALGAWLAFILMDYGYFVAGVFGFGSVQLMAFAFAIADVMLIYFCAYRFARPSPATLLLIGVTLGMLANSGILLSRYVAKPERVVAVDHWLMGGVDVLGYQPVLVLLLGVIPCVIVLLLQSGKLDQIAFSPEIAASRGVHVGRVQFTILFTASLLTALIVSVCGPIAFVGLVIPHVMRGLAGPLHSRLMPLSCFAGGVFLCACDIAARMILPGETPIGILTTLFGGVFFLYLLLSRRVSDWG